MSDFSENKDSNVERWLEVLPSITIEEFCKKWIPRLFVIDQQLQTQRNYRRLCVNFLMKLTDKQHKTVQNWITYPDTVPDHIKKYLGVVDLIWKIRWNFREFFPEINKFEAISSIIEDKNAENLD